MKDIQKLKEFYNNSKWRDKITFDEWKKSYYRKKKIANLKKRIKSRRKRKNINKFIT